MTGKIVDKAQILRELKEYKKFKTDVGFAEYLGVSTQNLSAWMKRNTFDINKIVDKFPEINQYWLMTGDGDMLKTDSPAPPKEARAEFGTDRLLAIIESQQRIIESLQKTIASFTYDSRKE